MDNNSIHTTVPQLRFPDFVNDGEWEVKRLGNVCKLTNGMAFKPSDWRTTGMPIVRIQNLNDEKADFNYCDSEIIDEKCLIDSGTLLFSWSGTPGTSFGAYIWNRGNAVLNQHIFIVDPIGIDKVFLKMTLDANMAKIIEKSHGGAGLRHITKSDLEEIQIFVPNKLSEQQRIATCLSSLDKVLSATKSKLEQLKIHKKGLMQKLFPAKGKKLPELRFKEFEKDGEWEEKKLQEIGEIIRGITYNKEDVSTNGLIVLRSSNIQDGRLVVDKDLVYVINVNPSERVLLQNHDIVICISNGSKNLVGKNAEYISEKSRSSLKITVGAFCAIFRPKEVPYKYILQTEHYQDFVARQLGGGNINNLNTSILENYSFRISSIAEQQKIANCLTSIDEMINQYTNKVALLELYKKGLMQQMFPTNNN